MAGTRGLRTRSGRKGTRRKEPVVEPVGRGAAIGKCDMTKSVLMYLQFWPKALCCKL